MSAAACDLPVSACGPMLRALMARARSGEWRNTPVGGEVLRFMRAFRFRSPSERSHQAYEGVLREFAFWFSDVDLEWFAQDGGTEQIREFLDEKWGRAAPATKQQRVAIIRSFFQWAFDERRITLNPTVKVKAPPLPKGTDRHAYDLTVLHGLVAAQDSLRDQCALQLLCRMALRKDELRQLRIRDIDLVRNYVLVHGKGAKNELLPLRGSLRDDLYLHIQGERRQGREYLLYARERRERPMDPTSIHRWFKRCVENAGLTATVKMHELRHSAADALRREHGDVTMAQMLLRHEHLSTTEAYLHPTKAELGAALDAMDAVWQGVRSGART